MNEFIMNKPMMTLTQFLQATYFIDSGGQAKYFLKDYITKVNGVVTTKRGKKLYPDDIVVVNEESYVLRYDQ